MTKEKGKRGTASMDAETRKRVASAGGRRVSQNREHMAAIGKKGGSAVSRDRSYMAELGRKGGSAGAGKTRPKKPAQQVE